MRIRVVLIWMMVLVWLISGCEQPAEQGGSPAPKVDRGKIAKYLLDKEPAKYDVKINQVLDNKIEILGLDYSPKPLPRNKPYTITFYFKVLGKINKDYQFFGHFEPTNGKHYRGKLDHMVANGNYRTNQWKKGDIIKDTFSARIGAGFPDTKGVLWAGFYKDDYRMPVASKSRQNSDDGGRLNFGTLSVEPPENIQRAYTVYKVSDTAIKMDGKLDEKEWQNAPETEIFVNTVGDRKVNPKTKAKMLWDSKYLYVAFDMEDKDIWTSYTKRDDPLYREETTEVFIDADGSRSTYYEIQVNPLNVVYDAYFPKRRKNMDIAWDSKIKSAVSIDGTVNKRDDRDKGWKVEIAVPYTVIEDAKNRPPKSGDIWKVNLFRMDRPTKRGTIGSMWSPTMVGDFHTLDRFGTVIFSDKAPEKKVGLKAAKSSQGKPVKLIQLKPKSKPIQLKKKSK